MTEQVTPKEDGRILTFADIAEADDQEKRKVWIEQWNGYAVVKGFTKAEQQELRRRTQSSKLPDGSPDPDSLERELLILGMIEPTVSPDQYVLLRNKSNAALDTLITAIMSINGMSVGEDEADEAEFRSE